MAALKSQMGLKESRMWHAREKERVFQVAGCGVCPKSRTQKLWTVSDCPQTVVRFSLLSNGPFPDLWPRPAGRLPPGLGFVPGPLPHPH